MRNGTYAIHNTLTGELDYSPAGKARPDEIDLFEDEELLVWDVDKEGGPGFVHVDPEATEYEIITQDIRAFLEAIEERLDDLDEII